MMNWICQLRCKGKIVLAMLKRVATKLKVSPLQACTSPICPQLSRQFSSFS